MKRELTNSQTSIESVQSSTRQRLQDRSTHHVYVLGNGLDNLKSNSRNPSNTSEISLETKNQNQQGVPVHPLKQLVFKKVSEDITEVRIRCIFLRVGEIDTLHERFYTEILLEASWETSAFKGKQNCSFDPAVHWTPQLELINGIGQLQDEITYSIQFDNQGLGTVTEHHKLKGTLWKRMELKDFPMDIQALSIIITTSHRNAEMKFVKNFQKPSGVYRRIFTDEQEWDLFEHVHIEITEENDKYLDTEHNHSVIICSCYAARKYGYFMWNAYFLIFLITSASFATFPIQISNIQGRIQIACILLLSSITFRWSCNKSLPAISYLTAVDVYAIGSIFSLCLLNIYHGVIGYVYFYTLPSNPTTATGESVITVIDRWALAVFTILFFGYQIGTLISLYLVPWKKRRMMIKRDHEHHIHIASSYNNSQDAFQDVLLKVKQTPTKE